MVRLKVQNGGVVYYRGIRFFSTKLIAYIGAVVEVRTGNHAGCVMVYGIHEDFITDAWNLKMRQQR